MSPTPDMQRPAPQQPASPPTMLVASGGPDEQLPPSARKSAAGSNAVGTPAATTRENDRPRRSLKAPFLAAAALLAALVIGPLTGGEESFDKWTHHEQASRHFESEATGIKWITPAGPADFVNGIGIDPEEDRDDATTQAFHSSSTYAEAEQIMRDAQQDLVDPDTINDLPVEAARPRLTDGMDQAILAPDTQFYHIYLYDSCDEDGDVVDLIINGQRFATVPITNHGTTLSVPIHSAATISVRGVMDGVGGITVACRTSKGEGFIRVLAEGEEQVLVSF